MKKSVKTNGRKRGRRRFLKTVALGAGAVAWPGGVGGSTSAATEESARQESASREQIEYPRTFSGRRRKMISFPLGGVGAGSIGLGGRGQLQEWWIFNRPDKGNSPAYAFPSIWVQSGGQKPVARVLEARILPPYEGPSGLGFADVPAQRPFGQKSTGLVDSRFNPIRGLYAVLCDVTPDFEEIIFRLRGEAVEAHPRC